MAERIAEQRELRTGMRAAKRRLLAAIRVLPSMLAVGGCGHTYVVLRDVPQNPSFAVIPANTEIREVEFANTIAANLLSCGVSVYAPPPPVRVTKENTVRKGETAMDDSEVEVVVRDRKHVESYWQYDELKTTYVVHTFRSAHQARIQIRETREVVAVVSDYQFTDPRRNATDPCKMIRALQGIGTDGDVL